MYAADVDNEFEINVHALQPVTTLSAPDCTMHDDEVRTLLAHQQLLQEEQKCDAFEATEAMIAGNKRSQIKKVRARKFSVGDTVLFKNPMHSSLATTLNVEGCIEEKVGRDLYRVGYGDVHVTLFASEMVPSTCNKGNSGIDIQGTKTWEQPLILDKICVYADMQRSFFAAKRRYKHEIHVRDMERKIRDIGYDVTLGGDVDLNLLFCIALDCGFLSTVIEDDQWNKDMEKYSTSLLAFLQDKQFHYFLSSIYWWECFRCQTVQIVIQCGLQKTIPLFHYCSECVDEGKCSHACCKLWLIQACIDRGIDIQMPRNHDLDVDGLTLLATVAIENSDKQLHSNKPSKPISKEAQLAWPLQKPLADIPPPSHKKMLSTSQATKSRLPLKLRKTGTSLKPVKMEDENLKRLKMNLTYRKYVQRNICTVSKKCDALNSGFKRLGNEIGKGFEQWNTLTDNQKQNLYLNTKYIVDTITIHKHTDAIKQARSSLFMQVQGISHYCSVCAFNNLLGKEVTTAREMNEVADSLWLRNFMDIQLSVTDAVQRHRDANGFHSIDTLQVIAAKYGYYLWTLDEQIQSHHGEIVPKSPQQLLAKLLQCYKPPVMLLIHNKETKHFTAIKASHHNILYFDSFQMQPSIMTAHKLMAIFAHKDTFVFSLSAHKQVQPASELPVSDQSSSYTVCIYIGFNAGPTCVVNSGFFTNAGGIYVDRSEV